MGKLGWSNQRWCTEFSDTSRRFAHAMDLLGKPRNAYWFRKSEKAYDSGFRHLGDFYRWIAKKGLYRQDWQDIVLFIQHGKI